MIFFIFILAMIMFYELKVAGGNEFNREYISPGSTTCINGVFVVLVFLSHICQYIKLDGAFDGPYSVLRTNLGQMVVVTFLFYSGYGIMESIKKKGYGKTVAFILSFIHFCLAECVVYVLEPVVDLGNRSYRLHCTSGDDISVGFADLGNEYLISVRGVCNYILGDISVSDKV